MNSLERIMAAMTGTPADRPAISLLLSLYGARLTGCPLDTYYTDAASYARGQSAVREAFQPDILFSPFALPLEGVAFGSQVSFYKDQAPNLARPVMESADDLANLAIPDIETHPQLIYFREAVRCMAAEHGAAVPVAAVALSPVDLPIMLLGIEGWLETVLFDEPGARRILDMTIPYSVRRINDLFAAGAALVVMPSAFVNPAIVTREVIERLALPALHAAFTQVHGPLVMHSGGARLAPFLDLFSGLPHVAGFVVNCGEELQLARQKAGPQAVLIGNIDGPKLRHAEPESIRADCARLLRECGNDPRFILGTSAADISYQTPPEHIHALCKAVRAVPDGQNR